MSSRRIGSTPFLELLPDSIAGDPAIRAAADALDGLLVPSVKAILSLLLYARLYGKEPDLLPPLRRLAEQAGGLRALEEPLLDLLAWQLHVDNYDIARTYAERLEMVKTAIAVHRKKGTPWAVETAVTAALGNVETTVTEWYDYEGGQPYHFKVLVTLFEQGIVADDINRARQIILETKNTRSHLDHLGITVALGSNCETRFGAVLGMGNTMTIWPEEITDLEQELSLNTGAVAHWQHILTIAPEEI